MAMPEIMEWFRLEGIELGREEGLAKGLAEGRMEGRKEGLMEGIRASKLEDARKMREHGIEWAVVTDITGVKPEDLEG